MLMKKLIIFLICGKVPFQEGVVKRVVVQSFMVGVLLLQLLYYPLLRLDLLVANLNLHIIKE